ncbi:MAG: hypothetical protein RBU23_02050 [Candidatus Auribacterota bacterium]|nr:hypothetical protein [Candidatus Auribacterota bacterium]
MTKNTWLAKLKRTLTSLLPISPARAGSCNRCGECCKLPNYCRFLGYDHEGLSYCKIYPIRPLNCRKYPRTASEQICPTCGFYFVETEHEVLKV